MSDRIPTAQILQRRRRISLICGCLCSALAASILGVSLPYFAIFAAAALCVVLTVWVGLLYRSR